MTFPSAHSFNLINSIFLYPSFMYLRLVIRYVTCRYKREEVKIQAWENHEKRKAEMEMRKMEVWLPIHSRQNYFFYPLKCICLHNIFNKSRVPKSCVAPVAILLEEMKNNIWAICQQKTSCISKMPEIRV